MKVFLNPYRDPLKDIYTPLSEPLALHKLLPGYAPTPMRDAPNTAKRLGVGRVSVKDESSRFGMPAFKILGASYAVYRAFNRHLQREDTVWRSLDEWRSALAPLPPVRLATATDGNHGRAVARMARLLGLEARIFVPQGTAAARLEAIAGEGAEVVIVEGSYDEAVLLAAQEANEHCLVISDTAWEGYTDVPQWVIEGYSTMFNEIDIALAEQNTPPPDIMAVQIGVGALAAAMVHHYRQVGRTSSPTMVGIEPTDAACVLESMSAGNILSLAGVQHSIMAGLNCGTPSPIAWEPMMTGIDAYVAIDDHWAMEAMRTLAEDGIVSGESGAAGLAGLLAMREAAEFESVREMIPSAPDTHLLIISTEGATDPDSYQTIVQDKSSS